MREICLKEALLQTYIPQTGIFEDDNSDERTILWKPLKIQFLPSELWRYDNYIILY
jgi:hypothetical protein